jgi:hypothetical protein
MSKHPFEYQKPTETQVALLQIVRSTMAESYDVLLAHVPACAERTLAIRKLEEASMWANKAIVFDGERYLV